MPIINLFDFTLSPRSFKSNQNSKHPMLTIDIGSYMASADFENGSSLIHVLIGKFSSLAGGIKLMLGFNHNYKSVTTYPFDNPSVKAQLKNMYPAENLSYTFSHKKYARDPRQILIGNDVWVGNGVTIMGGVHIGSGAVIGTDAVVAKNIPPYAIAVGNPAHKKTIKKFLAIKWWNWDIDKIFAHAHTMYDVEKFLVAHYSPELEKSKRQGGGQEVALIGQYILEERKIYNFIADFRSPMPLWKRVVKGFLSSRLKNAVLILWCGFNVTQDDVNVLKNIIEETGFNDGKIIHFLPPIDGQIFLPQVLRKSTHFITSRELITIDCLDWLYDTDVKILSALDEGIFEGEPIVDWNKI